MTNIDQFESVFKAADKPAFVPETVRLQSLLMVTTLEPAAAAAFESQAIDFLKALAPDRNFTNGSVRDADFSEVHQLLEVVQKTNPDLICTYRNLKLPARDYPFSLGVFVDVLTQASHIPVLLLPTPAQTGMPRATPQRVMAITDHLTGDHHLVSYAAELTPPGGKLWLAHVEDEADFERIVQVISKIPSIDTDPATEAIMEQLMKEPHDYIGSCQRVLHSFASDIEIEESITLGHRLIDFKRLIEEHQIDLVVMNTKDDDQLAMHGLAYPLAVELRETPLLLL